MSGLLVWMIFFLLVALIGGKTMALGAIIAFIFAFILGLLLD